MNKYELKTVIASDLTIEQIEDLLTEFITDKIGVLISGLCECKCRTCPIGALGYGTIGCLEMISEHPLFGKDIDDACYKDID